MRVCRPVWCALTCVALHAAHAVASHASGAVVSATEESWKDAVLESPFPAFVLFHSTARQTLPDDVHEELRTLATKFEGMADVVTVDCEGGTLRKLCQGSESVAKLPTMRVYAAARKQSPYTKEWYKEHEPYEGQPRARQMTAAIQAQMSKAQIARISSLPEWQAMKEDMSSPKVLVFSNKDEPSLLMRSVAMHFDGRLDFALVAASLSELQVELHVGAVPAVVLVHKSGTSEVYDGPLNAVALSEFLRRAAPASMPDDLQRDGLQESESMFQQAAGYRNVTVADLEELLEAQEDMWLLAAVPAATFAWHSQLCPEAVAQVARVADAVAGVVDVAIIRVTEDDSAQDTFFSPAFLRADPCNWSVGVKPFGNDLSGDEVVPVPADLTAKAALSTVHDHAPDLTVHMTQQTMAPFIGAQPGGVDPLTPKVILATAKHGAPPTFKMLALKFRHKNVVFGWFCPELDPEVAQQLPPPKLPYLMAAYVDTEIEADEQGRVPLGVEAFNAPFKFGYMAQFVDAVAARWGGGADAEAHNDGTDFGASGPVTELVSSDSLDEACIRMGGLCLIALLDPQDAAHQQHLDTFTNLKQLLRQEPVHFAWADARRQRAFVDAFVSISSLPTAIMLSPKKLRFSAMTAPFTQSDLAAFVTQAGSGRLPSTPYSEMPPLVDENAAQVQEEAAANIDDEFLLSDIMGTHVSESISREDELKQATAEAKEDAKRLREEAAAAKEAAKVEARKAANAAKKHKPEPESQSKDEL